MSEITAHPIPDMAVPEGIGTKPADAAPSVDWHRIYTTPEGRAVLAVVAGIVLGFAPFLGYLSGRWLEPESLYSHGPLVPLMAAYIVYDHWPRLRSIPVRGVTWGIVPILLVVYATWFASRSQQPNTNAALLLLSIPAAVLFVGGWRWLVATIGPILYLVFCLPFWDSPVDRVTQPLQMLSTDMSVRILNLSGLHPMRVDTTIYLDHYQFTVAAACSGAKLTLSLLAFACFFMLLNRGRWYSSVALLLLLVPISLLINGLRIALVGIFGNAFGAEAGSMFHDYGAYGVLIVSFLLLGQLTRLLGFK